jgi:hypothetical protein
LLLENLSETKQFLLGFQIVQFEQFGNHGSHAFRMLRMHPRRLSDALRAGYCYEGQSTCPSCHKPVEFWKPPGQERRTFDEMLSAKSPVVEHVCNSHRDPSPRSRSRFIATGW